MKTYYDPKQIEQKWQRSWEENGTFRATNERSPARPKFYVLDMFPYPSGTGLHVGHPRGYVASDVVARFKRMQGFDVLHPMGWDSFGLPTERQADKERVTPVEITERNIATFRAQLKSLGLSYDWSRQFATSDPDYYKWTQWIFLKLYEHGLAYIEETRVNWCPALKTVLANEEVHDGVYIETGDPVEPRMMKQWMLRITAYAERLLQDLDLLDWPESLKEMQRNWIGKSEGARIRFAVEGTRETFDVFTTRPDTLFGCTFCVLAPEHPLAGKIVSEKQRPILEDYIAQASKRSNRDRISQGENRTGVYTGANAINPVNSNSVQIWISDYVIGKYGYGAVFGCPAHDTRDYAFARQFNIPIIQVVKGEATEGGAYTGDGIHYNSGFLNGLYNKEACERMIGWLEEHGNGERELQYALRDWLFSRQRYWGEPIPMLHCQGGVVKPVREEQLPIELPSFLPPPGSEDVDPTPLSRAKDWMMTVDPEAGPARRETNTMPQWAGSSWYFLRFTDPHNTLAPWSPGAESKWMPVDLYVGGAEHATLHLLYARFWHKFLFDIGLVSTPEPFKRLFNQGMVLSRSFQDENRKYYYAGEVELRDGSYFSRQGGQPIHSQIEKMSKSRKNGIPPEDVIAEHGADSLRLYEVFMGPLEDSVLWQTEGIAGVRRFLDRAWRLFDNIESSAFTSGNSDHAVLERVLHQTIRKVTEDIENLKLNTAVSQLMIFVNEATKTPSVPIPFLEAFVLLMAPFACHLAEELWQKLGHSESIAFAQWPTFDPSKCVAETISIVVQVNGKPRGHLILPPGALQREAEEAALKGPAILKYLEGREVKRTIFVPDRLLNIVV